GFETDDPYGMDMEGVGLDDEGAWNSPTSLPGARVVRLPSAARSYDTDPSAQYAFRQLSYEDRLAYNSGNALSPKSAGGTIADQVAGKPTKYVSASASAAGTERFDSGNGLVKIDVSKAISGGAGYVEHNNVLQAVQRAFGRNIHFKNAQSAEEVMFKNGIPREALELIRDGLQWLDN
ncbi:MAG: insecticidal toxin complex protein, partial [Myxococcales bacterium]|nr:insecticidal toxin complex protein [Myxococcales bacterium]